MSNPLPYVISISRQLGCGGAFLGQWVATQLGISYADREILQRAAKLLCTSVEEIESREESTPTLVEKALEALALGSPLLPLFTPPLPGPGCREIQETESTIIRQLVAQRSAVVVGRAAFHALSGVPRHLSVFLHADKGFRANRLMTQQRVTRERAIELIEEADRVRARHLQSVTGKDWTDATQYHISLSTSHLGLETAGQMICAGARSRFGSEESS